MSRIPLRLVALVLALGAVGAGVALLRADALEAARSPLLYVPLAAFLLAGLVALVARAFGRLQRWGLLVGAGAYVAMGALYSFELGLGAMLAAGLWAAHDADAGAGHDA